MTKYVLVIKNGNNVKIGRHEYTREQADKRLLEVRQAGIKNMEIMEVNEAYGIK